MIRLAVEELCETADSLIAPVRLGVARPTAPFTLASTANDIINVSYVLDVSFIRVVNLIILKLPLEIIIFYLTGF